MVGFLIAIGLIGPEDKKNRLWHLTVRNDVGIIIMMEWHQGT